MGFHHIHNKWGKLYNHGKGVPGGNRDSIAPTCVLSTAATDPVSAAFSVTATFSEDVTGFVIGDITVTNGAASNFATVSAMVYTFDVTPAASGSVAIQIEAGKCTDAAGNANAASNTLSISALVYTLLDQFTSADAAPVTSPRTCEPGPGTITTTDPASKNSIASGAYVIGTDAGANVRGFFTDVPTFAAGQALFANILSYTGSALLLLGTAFNASEGGYYQADGYFADGHGNVGNIVSGTGVYALVRTTGGHIYYLKDNKIIFTYTGAKTTNYGLTARCNLAAQTAQLDNVAIVTASAPLVADFGIATSRVAISTNGQTATQEANAIVEHTITAATGVTQELMFRRVDDDNTWIVRCDQTNSKIFLYEKQGGIETERGATGGVAQTWTNTGKYRVVVICDGTQIYVCAGTATGAQALKLSYASASFNQSATGVKVSHAGTELILWPRSLSGAALAEVQRVYPF